MRALSRSRQQDTEERAECSDYMLKPHLDKAGHSALHLGIKRCYNGRGMLVAGPQYACFLSHLAPGWAGCPIGLEHNGQSA